MSEPLALTQVQERLGSLQGWKAAADARSLRTEFLMKDFAAAVELIAAISAKAEELDHHPDLHLTGYRTLAIELSTHDAGGLTEKDFVLAAAIDALPKKLKAG